MKTVGLCLLGACMLFACTRDAKPDAPAPAEGPFIRAAIAGTYGQGWHDEAWVLNLRAIHDGKVQATLYYIESTDPEAGSPMELMRGELVNTTRLEAAGDFTVDPLSGAISGDFGAGVIKETPGGLEVHLTEKLEEMSETGYLVLRADFVPIF